MTTIVVFGTLSLLGLFFYLGTTALSESTQRTLQERVVLAQTTARHLDYIISGLENVLTETAAQHTWQTPLVNNQNLAVVFQRLDFYATRIFLIEPNGQATIAFPPIDTPVSFAEFASVQSALSGNTFTASRYLRTLDPYGKSTLAATPIRDARGRIIGALAISIDLLGSKIRTFSNSAGLGKTGYIDLVDLGGTILASTRDERIGAMSDHEEILGTLIRDHRESVSACHDCHTTIASAPIREVLAFAPLDRAQWGVAVRQGEDEVFASIQQLQTRIFAMMTIMLVGALALVYLTARSIITPIQALTTATQRIAVGDLDTPLGMHGRDEIGVLTAAFEAMRVQLKNLMARIQSWNRELDAQVRERTVLIEQARSELTALYAALQKKEQMRGELLRRVITVQEEERKRISRELHDETAQVLTGLAYALDDAAEMTTEPALKPQLERMHTLASTALDEIHRLILDLRPTILDHLGLIPALRWYAESHLQEAQIHFTFREIGKSRRLSPAIEIAVFRVVQEAINNVARHSKAAHTELTLQFKIGQLQATLSDDGTGFEVDQVFNSAGDRRGLGLLGMQERIEAIGGQLSIRSTHGAGTVVQLQIPIDDVKSGAETKEHSDGKANSNSVGR